MLRQWIQHAVSPQKMLAIAFISHCHHHALISRFSLMSHTTPCTYPMLHSICIDLQSLKNVSAFLAVRLWGSCNSDLKHSSVSTLQFHWNPTAPLRPMKLPSLSWKLLSSYQARAISVALLPLYRTFIWIMYFTFPLLERRNDVLCIILLPTVSKYHLESYFAQNLFAVEWVTKHIFYLHICCSVIIL